MIIFHAVFTAVIAVLMFVLLAAAHPVVAVVLLIGVIALGFVDAARRFRFFG